MKGFSGSAVVAGKAAASSAPERSELQRPAHLQLRRSVKTKRGCIKHVPDTAFLCKQMQAGREVMWWGVGHETIF